MSSFVAALGIKIYEYFLLTCDKLCMCIFRQTERLLEFYTQFFFFYICIRRICYDFTRFNLLRNALSVRQITNSIKLLVTSLEVHHLQNNFVCEMKTTEQAGLEST